MAHWQAVDGTRSSVLGVEPTRQHPALAAREHSPVPGLDARLDWETPLRCSAGTTSPLGAAAIQGRRRSAAGDVPFRATGVARALSRRSLVGAGRVATSLRPADPMSATRTAGELRMPPGQIALPWLREAVKWQLGTSLEAGHAALDDGQPGTAAHACDRFDAGCQPRSTIPAMSSPTLGAAGQAAAFRRWDADPPNRAGRGSERPPATQTKPVHPRLINDDLRAVAELFAFVAANRGETTPRAAGRSPWQQVTEAHAASWFRQVSRIPHTSSLNDRHYIDDHALAQIPAALPLLGLARDEQMRITRGDGTQVLAAGFDDPQAMRMILLQILTGRRASEIRTCAFDCLSPVPERPVTATERRGGRPVPLRPKQDRHRAGQHPRRPRGRRSHPGAATLGPRPVPRARTPRYLFLQRTGNRRGDKPYPSGTYSTGCCASSATSSPITDSKGRLLRLSHTHRFRAHPTDPARRARPAHPRAAALCRARHADDVDALRRATRGTRRAGVPGHRQAQGRRQPGAVLPARTTTACTCSTGPTDSCPTAGVCCPRCRPATRATPA